MSYEVCNALLMQSDDELSAAEAHGMAAGMLCVNKHADSAQWLAELLHNAAPVKAEDKALLVRLFEETRRLLASEEFEFDLFLPDEEALLSQQVEALKNWCRGFLFGAGTGSDEVTNWPNAAREVLKDVAEFTRLDTEAEGEEDENALMEITEYLRSAVILLRDELSINSNDTIPRRVQ